MTCTIIDGHEISRSIRAELSAEVATFRRDYGVQPRLAVVLVGEDAASQVYVKKKREACEEVGIASYVTDPIPGDIRQWANPQARVEDMVRFLNGNEEVHGILVQLPLPVGLDCHRVFDLIDTDKDVDVFNPVNVGLLVQGRPKFLPCTPHAVQQLLHRSGIPTAGRHVVIINRSDVVGKPLSSMLIQDNDEYANATVTVCHDRTPGDRLAKITRTADIVVVAVGKPGFLTGEMIRPGCVVVDVGISRVDGKVVGDAHPSCMENAAYLTPVPGGVGPLTVTMLLENTLRAARLSVKNQRPN